MPGYNCANSKKRISRASKLISVNYTMRFFSHPRSCSSSKTDGALDGRNSCFDLKAIIRRNAPPIIDYD